MSLEPKEERRRLRILVVDDDELMRRYLAGALRAEADVECAGSVEEALAKIDACVFDAVLTDYELKPGLGTALLAHVRACKPRTRRYLMSADDVLARRGAGQAGQDWDGFFHKPFEVRALLAVVRAGASRSEGGEDGGAG